MQRWHPRRIGGNFIANAEAVAERALMQPSVGMAEAGFSCRGEAPGTPSRIQGRALAGGDDWIEGFSKTQAPELMGKQVMLGMVATLIGAPSAPYLHVRGIERIFSPLCVASVAAQHRLDLCDPATLGAAGQFRAWINDGDNWQANSACCARTNAFYLYDHEYAHPEDVDFGQPSHTQPYAGASPRGTAGFIAAAAAARPADAGWQAEHWQGAAQMAERIAAVTEDRLLAVAARVTAAPGLALPRAFAKDLAARCELFETPALLMQPGAQLAVQPDPRPDTTMRLRTPAFAF